MKQCRCQEEHGSREPAANVIRKVIGGNAVGKCDELIWDPRGDGFGPEHATSGFHLVGEGLVEADGDTGWKYALTTGTAEPAEEQQACGVCKAGREERAVLDENAGNH